MQKFNFFFLFWLLLLVAKDMMRYREQSGFVQANKDRFAKSAEFYEQFLSKAGAVADLDKAHKMMLQIKYCVDAEHSTNGFIVFKPQSDSPNLKIVICITDTSDENSFTCFILKDTKTPLKFMHNFQRVKSKILQPKQKIDFVGSKMAHDMHAQLVGDKSVANFHYVNGAQKDQYVQQTMCYLE